MIDPYEKKIIQNLVKLVLKNIKCYKIGWKYGKFKI